MHHLSIKRIASILLPILLLTSMIVAPHQADASAAAAYQVSSSTEINRSLAEISRAERAENWHLMYDLMLPEARMQISRTAFVNWWPTVAPAAPADVLKILDLEFADITYELTDTGFGNVAFVTYSYHDADGNEIERTMQLAEVGGVWRWMPDVSADQVPEINTHAGFTVNFTSAFSTQTYQEIDLYWAQIFSDWGMEYRPPVDMIGVRVEGTPTGCGAIDDLNDVFAQYCTLDETIYFNPVSRDYIIERFGQAAWDMIMAHEWGHHIQNISGLYVTKNPELFGGHYSIEHELMADCLSATFMQDATARGIFDMRSIREMDLMIERFGDSDETTWDALGAHGTGEQRLQSFQTGFDDGLRGCNLRAS